MKQLVICTFASALLLLCQPLFAYKLLTEKQLEELSVLEDTYSEEDEKDDELVSKTLTLPKPGPKIELLKPRIDKKRVKPPLDIELVFTAPKDAEINPDSLRIYYRKFGIYKNVTKRVLENATFDDNRLISENVEIDKKGKHRIKVVIKDTLGRKSEEEFKFRI